MPTIRVDPERANFQADRLQSLCDDSGEKFAHRTKVTPIIAVRVRAQMGLSQSQFAKLLGVSARTLQEWEQDRKRPTGAAQTLLRVAVQAPEALLNLQ